MQMNVRRPRLLRRSRAAGPRWRSIVAALLVADAAFGFQQTGITPALPAVQQDLGASQAWTAWVLSGYLVVGAISPPLLGKLADRSGKKLVLLAALTVFLVGSIGAALAPNIGVLVACRTVQGIGGVAFPLSFSIVRDEVPEQHRASAIGLLSGSLGVGAMAGYVLGGGLAELLSWRWIFVVGAAALLVGVALAAVVLPSSPTRDTRIDAGGALLFGGALATLLLALTEGPQQGWQSALVVGSFAAAALLAIGFVVRETHTRSPLMELRVLTSRPVLATQVSSLLTGYVLFATNLLIPYLVVTQTGLGLFGLAAGPLMTGLLLLPRALGQAVTGPIAGPLLRRFGPATTFCGAMLLMAGGALGLALARDSAALIVVETAALGAGFGLSVSTSGTIVVGAAVAGESGVATALNAVLRRTGGGIGAQASVALLAAAGATGDAAFTVAFLTAGGAALLGAVTAALSRPRRQPG
ncbi:MAG: MFS transporter [Pseudonocardiaceae bacterium]|nr:MFS transporter [Pseudonocardiaceae bacterium]